MQIRAALLVVIIITAVATSRARAFSGTEFSLSGGWAQLELEGINADELEREDGGRLELRLSSSPFDDLPQLRAGVGMGFSYFRHDEDSTVDDVPGFPFDVDVDDFQQLMLFVPELQLSWRHHFTETFFIEPGVAGGMLITDYRVGRSIEFDDDPGDIFEDTDIDEGGFGWSVRPFIRLGLEGETASFGMEASYLSGDADIDTGVGDGVEELFIGGFFNFRF